MPNGFGGGCNVGMSTELFGAEFLSMCVADFFAGVEWCLCDHTVDIALSSRI